jgi:hypothetical protein
MQQDGIKQVQADLCERIDGLRAAVPFGTVSGLCDKAADVRHLAQRFEMRPIADLAWKLEGRLARGERGPAVLNMLSLMREASECGRTDPQAATAWAAAASIRLA